VVALAPNHEFENISFVNGVYTRLGGSHVKHVIDQICKRVAEKLSAKKKDVTVKPNQIRPHLLLLLNSVIEDPAFDSQSKETLTSPVSKFGSRAVVSDKAIDKISKLGLYERAMALHGIQDQVEASKSDGRKTRRITGVPKLTDAEKAGGPDSHLCTLMLVEGDSAKTGVIGGMTAENRDYYGVFPLRGKLLNVRGSSAKQINENPELTQFKKIMGLENGRTYGPEDIKRLRYGKVRIVTDQDKDGSHIKGLIANAIDVLWPSLLAIPGFLGYMNTPILKATKGSGKKKETMTFYSERDYQTWIQSPIAKGNWEIKYYKGLGTSTGPEFRQYLADPQVVDFVRSSQDPKQLDAALDLAFNSKRANERKGWIEAGSLAEVDATPPIYCGKMEMSQFVNGELRGFSIYDCDRSIPSVIDGFKTSIRKIIFSCFKRNLTKELKVAQLAGYVAEHSLYHHGEGSLNGAIINLAQNYTGSNNINLLVPAGQFGSRVLGGKDAASPRYIFTYLSPLARLVFPEHDDAVLEFLQEDGIGVEPRHYVPIIPMLLVNGSRGIGTGYSSDVPCYDVGEVIRAVRARVQGQPSDGGGWVPSWRGFKGTVTIVTNPKTEKKSAITQGIVRKVKENVYEITELPITMCHQDLKNKLEALSEGKRGEEAVKDYKEYNTVDDIRVLVEFRSGVASDVAAVVQMLGLTDSIKLSNMHAFNSEGRITKYDGPEAILDEYIPVRRALYVKRKEHLIKTLTEKANALHEQAIFVRALCDGKLVVSRRPDEEVEKNMVALGIRQERVSELLGMSIRSQTESKVAALEVKVKEAERELAAIKKATIEELWLHDLAALEKGLAAPL
jgi:DNA topoisomerase-2